MSEIQRLEYLLWFKGNGFDKKHFAQYVESYMWEHNLTPVQAMYGVIEVPEEDIGEDPHDSSNQTVKQEEA